MYLLLEHFHLFAHSALVVLQPIFLSKQEKKETNWRLSWVIKILCCHGTIVTQSKITHWYLFCHKYSSSKAHTVPNRFKLRHVIVLQYFWPWLFFLPLFLLESGKKKYSSTSITLTKYFTAIFLIGGQQNGTWTN